MPQVKTEVETFARIKAIGVGGSGKNAINHMINAKVKGIDFIAINTDAQGKYSAHYCVCHLQYLPCRRVYTSLCLGPLQLHRGHRSIAQNHLL